MGATESVFYDDAPIEEHPRPMMAQPPPLSPSDKPRPRPVINDDEAIARRNQGPQLQKPPRRRAPPPAKPIKRMEGLVVGGPKTGKRTLLSRLKGVDPFLPKEQQKSSNTEETDETGPSIIIQYKPPSESPTWDRIKLRIQYASSVEESTTSGNIDFVVMLVSPKNSRKSTQSYLKRILAEYLDHLEYRKATGADNDQAETETGDNNHAYDVSAPFCMAILFNFRDLEEGQVERKNAPISRTTLRRIVDETLRSRKVHDRKVVVELLETSLFNCYGLDGLHRFIYRTYLQRCQTDIERQLDVVRNQIQLTEDKNRPNDGDNSTKVTAYDEFLKEITPKEEVPRQVLKQRADPMEEKEEPVVRRMNFRPTSKQTQSLRMGKDALEAFLASSSDEDEIKQTAVPAQRRKFPNANGYASSSSDDDSDDDFFYDESGNRRHQIQNQPKIAVRNEVSDDASSDSSDTEDEKNEENRGLSSLQRGSRSRPTRVGQNPTKIASQTEMADDESSDPSSSSEGDHEGKVPKSTANESEEEVVDKVDESKDVSANEIETQDEIQPAIESSILDNNETDENSLRKDSREQMNDEVDGKQNETADSDTDDTADNGDDDNDIAVADTLPLKSEHEDDNDNDDDDDDDDDDDGFMIGSTPDTETNEEEEEDDDDDDGDNYVIKSTPDTETNDDDDNDDYMINSSPVSQEVIEDDSEDDGYMIGATSTVEKTAEVADDDDDDDDDGFMIGHTPMPNENSGVDDDDDDSNSDFIIEENVTKHNNENTKGPPTLQPESMEKPSPGAKIAPPEPLQPTTHPTERAETPAASGGISQAALAAIAAAQAEAEAMMRQQQQQYSEIPSSMMKEKKSKKKKKEEKKKKKKKKSKSSDE